MLRAFLHVKKPEAEGSYVLLASSVAWKRLVLSAQWQNPVVTDVDLAERIKAISDILVPADAVFITFTKGVQDQITFLDSISYTGTLGKSDTATVSDDVGKLVDKSATDAVSMSDGSSFSFSKFIADAVSLADDYGLNITFSGALETLVPSDSIAFVISRAESDNVSVIDQPALIFTKFIDDIIMMSDGLNISLGGISNADSTTVTDAVAFVVQKAATDTVTPTDAVAFVLQSYLSDTSALTDDVAKAFTKSSTDSVSMSDDFSLVFVYGRTSILNGFALNEASLND